MVDSINSVSALPVPVAPNVGNVVKKDNLQKVIEDNNKTTKLCSGVALLTSCATLLPLSILAVKTGKISKVVENFGTSIKPIVKDLSEASHTINNLTTEAGNGMNTIIGKARDVLDLAKTDEVKNLLNELSIKVKETDTKPIVESVSRSIDELSGTLNGKLGEIDTARINELVGGLKEKIDLINVDDLSAEARNALNALVEKIKGTEIKFDRVV